MQDQASTKRRHIYRFSHDQDTNHSRNRSRDLYYSYTLVYRMTTSLSIHLIDSTAIFTIPSAVKARRNSKTGQKSPYQPLNVFFEAMAVF